MRRTIFSTILLCVTLGASAADDSMLGTHWAKFQPIQVAGDVQGCSLVFLAVHADHAYLNGDEVAVNGSMVLHESKCSLSFMLKIGLKRLTSISAMERPAFAYIQTATASTAKSRQQSPDGEPGYKLFIYSLVEKDVLNVLTDLIELKKVSIGYSRKIGGMDLLVPIDLMVVDSEYTNNKKVVRARSPEAVNEFAECVQKISGRALEDQK